MFGTSEGQRDSAELPYTPTYRGFSLRIPIYSGLVSVTKWRLIMYALTHQKTPDNEPLGPRQPLICSRWTTIQQPIDELFCLMT